MGVPIYGKRETAKYVDPNEMYLGGFETLAGPDSFRKILIYWDEDIASS